MTAYSELLLPAGVLVVCLNTALGSLLACGLAAALSRCSIWSLPVRHALLVAALAISLAVPVGLPLFDFPSVWTFRTSEESKTPTIPVAVVPNRITQIDKTEEFPTANSIPIDEPSADWPANSDPATFATAPVAAPFESPGPVPERRFVSSIVWARLIGTGLCGIWFTGIAFGLARATICLAKLSHWRQTVARAESPLLAAAAKNAAETLGLRTEIAIYCSKLLPAPITFGLIRPHVVVPSGIESSLPADQLRAVILHELAHVARHDLWIGLLQQVAQIVYWWNPLVRLVNRQLADLREQICDDIATRDLPEPAAYAATLLNIVERCSQIAPIPATLGIGSSPARQLENRIRRIVSSPRSTCVRLSRGATAGVLAIAVLMAATILVAQVRIEPPAAPPSVEDPVPVAAKPVVSKGDQQELSLHDLIQQMAAHEQAYLPFDIKALETFRFPDDLTPQEKAKNLRADGRKHQRLMEYAQVEKRIWRRKETSLVDDEVEQGPYEQFSDGERIIQRSPSPFVIDDVKTFEYHLNHRKNDIFNYLHATPLCGIFCLSSNGGGGLFSQTFEDEEGVELSWDKGDARLTFGYGKPHWNTKFVLWLSRENAWHPIRLQRYWDAKDELFFDEWEVTKFVQRGKTWRVAEGTHRYRELKGRKVVDPRIAYSMDFKVLTEKYGSAVDEKQFQITIPDGARIHDEQKPDAEPSPSAKTREITVTVVDIAGKPIPKASVRLPANRIRDLDNITTDDQGLARSAKAPEGNVSVHLAAAGYRPVTWIMGDVNELRAMMAPVTHGVVVDRGKPSAEAWITNESLQIRADGFTYVPDRDWDGQNKDWSDVDGRFELKTNLTLRRPDTQVSFIAVDQSREKMAIRFVPARNLGQKQELVLQPVCHVRGHCLLKELTELVEVDCNLEAVSGEYIGFLSARKTLTPEGLRVDFQLRLPPGGYVLKSRESSHHTGFEIPFTVNSGSRELDLGSKTVLPTGAVALRGKPAPALSVAWRPGQEATWENFRGKVVVLDFWGTWCVPCVAAMPTLMEIHDQFLDQPVEWLSVHTPNFEDFDELDREVAKREERDWNGRKLPFTMVLDRPLPDGRYSGQTSKRYGVAEWPTLIVVDQQGKVVGPVQKTKLAETLARLLSNNAK